MRARLLLPLLFALLLVGLPGCGGGGGGGGGKVTVTPHMLRFEARLGGTVPEHQIIRVSYPSGTAALAAYYLPGSETADWIQFAGAGGANPLAVGVYISSTAINAGLHSVAMRIGAFDQNGNELGHDDLTVNYTIYGSVIPGPASVDLVQLVGQDLPTASVSLAADGGFSYAWSAAVVYADVNGWLTLNGGPTASGSSMPTTLHLGVAQTLAEGTYHATIQVTANGEVLDIPVSYTHRKGGLLSSPQSLAFAAQSDQLSLPLSQSLSISSEAGTPLAYDVAVSYGAGASDWLGVPSSGSSGSGLTVQPGTTALAPGSYSAEIALTPANGGAVLKVPVTYQVSGSVLSANPSRRDFVVDGATTAGALASTITLSRSGGAVSWTATASAPWLSVSPAAGTSGSGENVTVSVVTSKLQPLDEVVSNANITFAYQDRYGVSNTLVVPVTLDMRLPRFDAMTPHVTYAGEAGTLVVRGKGFNALAGETLMLGNNSVSDYTVVNDGELRFPQPLLDAGTYKLTDTSPLGAYRSAASLAVVAAPSYPYAVLPTANWGNLKFDPERQALYVFASWANLKRYVYNGSGWDLETLAVKATDVGMTADGSQLIVAQAHAISHVDPDKFTVISTTTAGLPGGDSITGLQFLNDGSALLSLAYNNQWVDLYGYAPATDAVSSVQQCVTYNSTFAASADLSTILLAEHGITSPSLYRYDQSSGRATETNIESGSRVSVSRDGGRISVGNRVYDSALHLLGSLPATGYAVISPDGTRGYSLDSSSLRVRIFELGSSDGAGGFIEVGTGITLADSHGTGEPSLVITPDGGTLFIGGNVNVLVVPLH